MSQEEAFEDQDAEKAAALFDCEDDLARAEKRLAHLEAIEEAATNYVAECESGDVHYDSVLLYQDLRAALDRSKEGRTGK